MKNKEITFFRVLFIISALWNLTGAIFGYFNTAYTFQAFFNRALTDPLFYNIYQGAWVAPSKSEKAVLVFHKI